MSVTSIIAKISMSLNVLNAASNRKNRFSDAYLMIAHNIEDEPR